MARSVELCIDQRLELEILGVDREVLSWPRVLRDTERGMLLAFDLVFMLPDPHNDLVDPTYLT